VLCIGGSTFLLVVGGDVACVRRWSAQSRRRSNPLVDQYSVAIQATLVEAVAEPTFVR
jgi:hypothetical protein